MQRFLIMGARILGPILLTKFLRDRKQKRRAISEEDMHQTPIETDMDETLKR